MPWSNRLKINTFAYSDAVDDEVVISVKYRYRLISTKVCRKTAK